MPRHARRRESAAPRAKEQTTMTETAIAELDTLKARLKATWMDGNYDRFSRLMEASAVEFLDR
jgi:hypothetical protein